MLIGFKIARIQNLFDKTLDLRDITRMEAGSHHQPPVIVIAHKHCISTALFLCTAYIWLIFLI